MRPNGSGAVVLMGEGGSVKGQISFQYSLLLLILCLHPSKMEIQTQTSYPNPILKAIVDSQNVTLLTVFISFLDDGQIQVLATAALKQKRQEKLYKIMVAKLFMARYLNKVDRGLFFLFYEDPQFVTIEKATTNSLACKLYPYLLDAFGRFQNILALFRTHTLFLEQHQELYDLVQTLFFNPDLPLPRMKRETIAMYAQTPLQQYLAMIHFSEEYNADLWLEEPLPQLKAEIEEEVIEKMGVDWMEQEREKVGTMIVRGYLVGSSGNLQDDLLEGFRTHNLVVLLLGLCSQVAQTYFTVLASIDDPMMRFTEFLLRATLYRNIVLALQEKFAFLNLAYTQLYSKIYSPPPAIPPFSFYRAALSMWLQGVQSHHAKNEKIYCYVISKLRENSLLTRLCDRSEKLPSFYGQLKEALELQEFSEQSKELAYSENGNELQLEGFFQDNLEMYEVIAKDYQDYFMDISVNEFTVHWCGHSQQKTEAFTHYAQYAKLLIGQSLRFYRFLKGKIEGSFPNELRISVIREMLREDIHFQLEKITTPAIVRQIVEALNEEIRQLVSGMQEYAVFGEEGLAKYLLTWDFAQKDDLIAYFAMKAGVAQDCPPQMRFYYNLQDDPAALPPKGGEEDVESLHSEPEVYLSDEEL